MMPMCLYERKTLAAHQTTTDGSFGASHPPQGLRNCGAAAQWAALTEIQALSTLGPRSLFPPPPKKQREEDVLLKSTLICNRALGADPPPKKKKKIKIKLEIVFWKKVTLQLSTTSINRVKPSRHQWKRGKGVLSSFPMPDSQSQCTQSHGKFVQSFLLVHQHSD